MNKCPSALFYSTSTGICDFPVNVPECSKVKTSFISNVHGNEKKPNIIHTKTRPRAPDQRPNSVPPQNRIPAPPSGKVPSRPLVPQKKKTHMIHSVHMDLPNNLTVNVLPPRTSKENELVGDSKYLDLIIIRRGYTALPYNINRGEFDIEFY